MIGTPATYVSSLTDAFSKDTETAGKFKEVTVHAESLNSVSQNPRLGKKANILDFDRGMKGHGVISQVFNNGDFVVTMNIDKIEELEQDSLASYQSRTKEVLFPNIGGHIAILLSLAVLTLILVLGKDFLALWSIISVGLGGMLAEGDGIGIVPPEYTLVFVSTLSLLFVFTPFIVSSILKTYWHLKRNGVIGFIATILVTITSYFTFPYLLIALMPYGFGSFFQESLGALIGDTAWKVLYNNFHIIGGIFFAAGIAAVSLRAISRNRKAVESIR